MFLSPGAIEGVGVELGNIVPVEVEAAEGGDLVDAPGYVGQPAVQDTATQYNTRALVPPALIEYGVRSRKLTKRGEKFEEMCQVLERIWRQLGRNME